MYLCPEQISAFIKTVDSVAHSVVCMHFPLPQGEENSYYIPCFCIQLRICWMLSQILCPVWLFTPWACPVFWNCLVREDFLTALCVSSSCLWIVDRYCLSWFCSLPQMNQHPSGQEGHEYESSPLRRPDASHFLTCPQQSIHAAEFLIAGLALRADLD